MEETNKNGTISKWHECLPKTSGNLPKKTLLKLKSKFINVIVYKIHIVKSIIPLYGLWFFPVVMYGCESWTVKKAERRRIDAFELGVGEDS